MRFVSHWCWWLLCCCWSLLLLLLLVTTVTTTVTTTTTTKSSLSTVVTATTAAISITTTKKITSNFCSCWAATGGASSSSLSSLARRQGRFCYTTPSTATGVTKRRFLLPGRSIRSTGSDRRDPLLLLLSSAPGGGGGGADTKNNNKKKKHPIVVRSYCAAAAIEYTSNKNNNNNIIRREMSSSSSSSGDAGNNNNNNNNDVGIWDGHDKDAFASLDHIGYSLQSDPVTHTGGWWAHRHVLQQSTAMDGGDDSTSYDWINSEIKDKITKYDYSTMPIGRPPRILVLYGSLRETSYSRKLAYEFARLLDTSILGCDVRVYNPYGLPVRDPKLDSNIKVLELRALTLWSDGHVWVSPEMHGTITGCFKNQIDWIPLNTGSLRPTQGRTCLVAQVNGGSQSFNAVNFLRLLARWMRMPCCTNQSSVAKAWKEFDDNNGGRMKESDFRDRVVDCAEEFAKFTAIMTPISDELTDRYSERKEKEKQGRLLTQAEKEATKK